MYFLCFHIYSTYYVAEIIKASSIWGFWFRFNYTLHFCYEKCYLSSYFYSSRCRVRTQRASGRRTLSRASRRRWPSTRPVAGGRSSFPTRARCTAGTSSSPGNDCVTRHLRILSSNEDYLIWLKGEFGCANYWWEGFFSLPGNHWVTRHLRIIWWRPYFLYQIETFIVEGENFFHRGVCYVTFMLSSNEDDFMFCTKKDDINDLKGQSNEIFNLQF